MPINFGKYDQRVIIQSYSETRNSSGDAIRTYATLYTLWAKVIPVGGTESNQANEKTASIVIDIEVRATGLTLNETMRLVWRGKTFNIDSIDEFGSRLNEGYKIRAIAKDND